MMTTTNQSLTRFLRTDAGRSAIAAYIGVRSTDPMACYQAEQTALHFAPVRSARLWTLADLRDAALRVTGAGVYAAKEVAL